MPPKGSKKKASNAGKAQKKSKRTKTQADKAETKLGKDQHELIVEFENMLKTVITRPSLWVEERFQFLRNFCHTVANNGERFPTLMGDRNEEVPSESEEPIIHPTEGYISAFAAGDDTSELTTNPVFSVLSRDTGFRDVMQHEETRTHQKVKLTHLTLVDGDNNTIHGRMATHIADAGRGLEEGDVIRLDLFTELTYHVNDNSQPMPALFILRYTRVGHISMPVQQDINNMLPYSPSQSIASGSTEVGRQFDYSCPDPLSDPPPACTYEKRLCRKFGVNFIGRCICEEIPVKDRDLNIIAEDCHLINKPVSELTNKSKRIMLYWWYATNIYSITGKGHRGKLPNCLEYAIKAEYPEKDSSKWVGYKPGPGNTTKNKSD